MSKYTKEDILRMVEEEDVEFIRLQFTDIPGTLKNMAITASQLARALDNKCMFDGSSIEGFVRVEESDMYLYPDLDTFAIFPWRPQHGKVARLICDIRRPGGEVFAGDSRYILKKELEKISKKGYRFDIGPECEFFLFDMDENGQPTSRTHEKAGYFDLGPDDFGENTRRDIVMTLEDMGFVVDASHHEAAPAQHEIDLNYDEALKAADGIVTFKLAVRTIARRHGQHATFMPKPNADAAGSGLHINMSLSKKGKNLFNDPKDVLGLSKEAYYFIGGIMKHIKGITAIANPTVNSYKRLFQGYEAPDYIAWSVSSRSTVIRIPAVRGENIRVELRSPDPMTNPYLTIALCLAAGMEGIEQKIMPPESVDCNIGALSEAQKRKLHLEALPANLLEALECLEKDKLLCDVLGEHICAKFIEAKKQEWKAYQAQVTAWETERYLNQF